MAEEYEDNLIGLYEALCQACDGYGTVNDIGLCDECNAKMDRDLIRKREWDYSASAFGCPVEMREELRQHIIKNHGRKLELLAEEAPKKKRPRSKSAKRKRKR